MINGKYLTDQDSPNFSDQISTQLRSRESVFGLEKVTGIRCMNISFVVTEACNLNCTYCYETHKTKRVMTKEIAKDAIDFILSDKVNNYIDPDRIDSVILDFIGGEPFLNIDVIDYAVEYFRKRTMELNHRWKDNYMINISSNGTLYFEPKVQDFINRNLTVLSMGITLDGNKELHDKCRLFYNGEGSYDIAKEATIDWIKKRCGYSNSKITLAPDNVSYLYDAIKNIFDLGINFAYTNCCYEEGWKPEHAEILYNQMIKLADYIIDNELYKDHLCSLFDESIGTPLMGTENWCGGNGDMLAIGTDGKLYPCIRFMDYSLNNQPEQCIGDIYNGIVETPFLCDLKKIDMITQCQHEDNKKCLDCDIAQGCSLCTAYNYDYYGDPNHKAIHICEMHKARVKANEYYWKKLHSKIGD